MNCGVGCRHDSDPALLGLWCGEAAVALIQPLAWELLCATGTALKSKKKKRERERDYSVPAGALLPLYYILSLKIKFFCPEKYEANLWGSCH